MKKNNTNEKIRLALRGQTIRDLRNLTKQELEQAVGAFGCGRPETSFAEDNCSSPH